MRTHVGQGFQPEQQQGADQDTASAPGAPRSSWGNRRGALGLREGVGSCRQDSLSPAHPRIIYQLGPNNTTFLNTSQSHEFNRDSLHLFLNSKTVLEIFDTCPQKCHNPTDFIKHTA